MAMKEGFGKSRCTSCPNNWRKMCIRDSVVLLYDQDGSLVGGVDSDGDLRAQQIILAPDPGDVYKRQVSVVLFHELYQIGIWLVTLTLHCGMLCLCRT